MSDLNIFDDVRVDGTLTLSADPTLALQGVTKQYVDGKPASITCHFNGKGSILNPAAINTAVLTIPHAINITGWLLVGNVSGGTLDVKITQSALAAYVPAGGADIATGHHPTISSGYYNSDTVLTGWTKALAAQTVLEISVVSCTLITDAVLTLSFTK